MSSQHPSPEWTDCEHYPVINQIVFTIQAVNPLVFTEDLLRTIRQKRLTTGVECWV